MPRTLLLAALCLALSSCGPAYVSVGPASPPPLGGYVYTYPDGSCWADDLWYASCPWYVGPQPGYYLRHEAHWYWQPSPRWGYGPGRPPPHPRIVRPPSRHHMVPPPRVRDHRRR